MHGANRPPFTAVARNQQQQIAADRPFGLPPGKRPRPKPGFGPTEDQIHRAVIGHLQQRAKPGVLYWHTANGGKRNRIEAARFQGLGVRAGVADLLLFYRSNFYSMEFKSSTGRPTPAQMQWASDVNAQGGHAVICHDLDRAVRVLECWGLIK